MSAVTIPRSNEGAMERGNEGTTVPARFPTFRHSAVPPQGLLSRFAISTSSTARVRP